MDYYYINKKGAEVGPINEDLLISMAKNGDLEAETQVRNALVKAFKDAEKIPCLKEILIADSAGSSKPAIAKHLHRSESSIQAPPINYRVSAFFLDCVVMGLVIVGLYNLLTQVATGLSNSDQASLFLAFCVSTPVAYYALTLGYKAQTFGFWFFGIMVIKGKGDPVFVGRAAIMALLFLLTVPLQPLLIFIFNKGIHEALTGTRVVNVKLG